MKIRHLCPKSFFSDIPVILVKGLGPVNRTKDQIWQEKLCQPNQPLDEDENICNQRYLAMSTLKSSLGVRSFVHFDNHQASNKRYAAQVSLGVA